jgi:colicin import membrane protein
MSRRQKSLTQGRWRAIALSLLLHSGIVAAAVYGWFTWKHQPPPVTTMAIEATVVDERALKGIAPPPEPEPEPPAPEPVPEPEPAPVEEQGPPKPDPAEVERKLEEERLAQEKLEQEKQAQEKERLEAEKEAVAKAAAEKAAADKAAAEKKAQEKKKAEEAAAAKKAADEKARQAREAELRRMLEQEERGNSARNSAEAAQWYAAIVASIERNWTRPASARPGVTCIVLVRQVPGGEVTDVAVNSCSIDDAALRESVKVAVLRASPLPSPPNQALFERNIELTFAPKE